METDLTQVEAAIRLAVAGLAGMAVGLEREWSGHASGPAARFAGIRTFLLLGAIGGISGVLLATVGPAIAAALLVASGGIIVAAYITAARRAAPPKPSTAPPKPPLFSYSAWDSWPGSDTSAWPAVSRP